MELVRLFNYDYDLREVLLGALLNQLINAIRQKRVTIPAIRYDHWADNWRPVLVDMMMNVEQTMVMNSAGISVKR